MDHHWRDDAGFQVTLANAVRNDGRMPDPVEEPVPAKVAWLGYGCGLLAFLAFAGILVGPYWDPHQNIPGFDLYNRTDRALSISYVEGGTEQVVYDRLDVGKSVELPPVSAGTCRPGDLIARDALGAEVARRTGPLCNSEVWDITASSRASP